MQALVTASDPALSAQNLWEKALDGIRLEGKSYALGWLARMRGLDLRDSALVLSVPDRFFRDWVDDHYRGLIEETRCTFQNQL